MNAERPQIRSPFEARIGPSAAFVLGLYVEMAMYVAKLPVMYSTDDEAMPKPGRTSSAYDVRWFLVINLVRAFVLSLALAWTSDWRLFARYGRATALVWVVSGSIAFACVSTWFDCPAVVDAVIDAVCFGSLSQGSAMLATVLTLGAFAAGEYGVVVLLLRAAMRCKELPDRLRLDSLLAIGAVIAGVFAVVVPRPLGIAPLALAIVSAVWLLVRVVRASIAGPETPRIGGPALRCAIAAACLLVADLVCAAAVIG